jgi:hypothetical protein
MLSGSEVLAGCIQWVAIVFIVLANVDRVLTMLAGVRLSLSGPLVGAFDAVACVVGHALVADSSVLARRAGARICVLLARAGASSRLLGTVGGADGTLQGLEDGAAVGLGLAHALLLEVVDRRVRACESGRAPAVSTRDPPR